MADGKIFYPSLYYSLKDIADDKTFRQAVEAVFGYAFDGEEPDMDSMEPTARIIYRMAKPVIESNDAKRTSGRRGGRPPKKSNNTDKNDKEADVDDTQPPLSEQLNLDELSGFFNDRKVADKMHEWLEYRFGLGDGYTAISAKKVIEEAQIAEKKYGAEACIKTIQQSIASGWRGIFWNKLEKQYSKNKQQYEADNGPAVEYEPTEEDYERIRRAMEKEGKAGKT